MSTLAAARADNFYYDPARFDPSVRERASVNALAHTHALGVRARRIKEGILVIRFEMPYDAWCLKCDAHVSRGVRFNADKQRAGMYLSTPIWQFRMSCPHCGHAFVIQSNPKEEVYEYVSGLRRKVKEFSAADAETYEVADDAEHTRARTDAFAKLENAGDDKRRARSAEAQLLALHAQQDAKWADDYEANKQLRKTARGVRAAAASALREGHAKGLNLPLLPENPEDAALARLVMLERDVGGGSAVAARLSTDAPAAAAAAAASAAMPRAPASEAAATMRVPPLASSFVPAAAPRHGTASAPSPASKHSSSTRTHGPHHATYARVAAAGIKRARSGSTDAASTAASVSTRAAPSVHTVTTKAQRADELRHVLAQKRAHTAAGARTLQLREEAPMGPAMPLASARLVIRAGVPSAPTACSSATAARGAPHSLTRAAVTSMLDGGVGIRPAALLVARRR